jgi:hypothetical protein
MNSNCRELPTVEECQEVARNIDNDCLRECVLAQCAGAKINCNEFTHRKCMRDSRGRRGMIGGYVYPGEQTCQRPEEEIYWCELPRSRRCRAEIMVHELAHSCGWHHGDGQGVPANNGDLKCR